MSAEDKYEKHMRKGYPSTSGKRWAFHMTAARLAKAAGMHGSYAMHVKEARAFRTAGKKRRRGVRRQVLKRYGT